MALRINHQMLSPFPFGIRKAELVPASPPDPQSDGDILGQASLLIGVIKTVCCNQISISRLNNHRLIINYGDITTKPHTNNCTLFFLELTMQAYQGWIMEQNGYFIKKTN